MREIYLDNCATTPADPAGAALALEIMTKSYGNPSSLHTKGLEAQLLLDKARAQLAKALGCAPEEVIFTAGGTEANNIALFGGYTALRRKGNRVVATAVEHSSVLEPLARLKEQGVDVVLIPPGSAGVPSPEAIAAQVDDATLMVSCSLVNGEVGAVADIRRIARLCKAKNPRVLIHTDAVQAFGKAPFSAGELGADLISISGHKLHAPKGIGALYVKKGVRLVPPLLGGGQERGLRPGTENVPLACAFGLVAEDYFAHGGQIRQHLAQLYEQFVNNCAKHPEICINSPPGGAPNICNISLPGWKSETLLHYLAQRGVYVSSGSACSKGADSHVLTAMGLPRGRVKSALRVSFSRDTQGEDIGAFFEILTQAMGTLARSND